MGGKSVGRFPYNLHPMAAPLHESTNPDSFAPRWAEYRRLRRNCLFGALGFVACGLVGAGVSRSFAATSVRVQSIVGLAFFLICFVCIALAMAAMLKLMLAVPPVRQALRRHVRPPEPL